MFVSLVNQFAMGEVYDPPCCYIQIDAAKLDILSYCIFAPARYAHLTGVCMGSSCHFIVAWCTLRERHRPQNCDNDGTTTTHSLVVQWSMKLSCADLCQLVTQLCHKLVPVSVEDRYRLVTVCIHGDVIVLPLWDIRPLAPWPAIPVSCIILTLSQPLLALS